MRSLKSAELDVLGALADLGAPVSLAGSVPASTIAALKNLGLVVPIVSEEGLLYQITDAGRAALSPAEAPWTGPAARDVPDLVPHARADGSIVILRGPADEIGNRAAYLLRTADGAGVQGLQALAVPGDETVRPLAADVARDIAGARRSVKAALDRVHRDPRLPPLGSEIRHRFRDGREAVAVLSEEGVRFEGQVYPTVSAAARAAGGGEADGFLFWGLKARKSDAARTTILVDFATPERLAAVRAEARARGRDLDDLMVEALALYLQTHPRPEGDR